MKYRNPVIPGFYPDPSICRVGDDYYLVTSSFEFFPGIPLFHSRDLVNWEQIGHVLTKDEHLSLKNATTSMGIYAPTIRYHNGRFYVITTNMDPSDFSSMTKNFIVWTDDIHGDWHGPFKVDHMGIDPSLFWDDEGKCYYQGTNFFADESGISLFEIDPDTGEKLSETKTIWTGSGGSSPEGPHLYKINGIYYLMIAEGGTEYGHMETVARSTNIWGPYESCPDNPIISHRHLMPSFNEVMSPEYVDIRCVGHADIVDDTKGNWWMVIHGVRPSKGQLHHIGRETFLAPVEWKDDWPVVNGGKSLRSVMEVPESCESAGEDGYAEQNDFCFNEDFTVEDNLPPRWAYLRNPERGNYLFHNGLILKASEITLDSRLGSPTFTAVRQQHMEVEVNVTLDYDPKTDADCAGFTVFHTNERHYDLRITRRDGKRAAVLYRIASDLRAETAAVILPDEGELNLKILADKQHYEFYVNSMKVGGGSTELLSTEAMAGTFTGCMLGMFCHGRNGSYARFTSFSVK